MRSVEPTRFGSATSQNCSDNDNVMPMLDRLITTIAQSDQMENPMCSAKIENARFLRAIRLPDASQKRSSSGSQCSIHRPRRAVEAGAVVLPGAWGASL